MNAVNFAIVGLGFGASRTELFDAVPGANLVAVADANPARAEEIGRGRGVGWFTDVNAVLDREDVDVVGIYTPSGMHRDVALAAAKAGKHLLMTKPLEVSLPRIDEILTTAADCGVEVFGEFYLRYQPDHYRMHQAITAGLLGPPILGDFAFKCYRPQWYFDMDGGWRGTKAFNGGGIMMNQAIHLVDLLYWHLGEVAEIQSVTGTFAHQIEVEDTAAAVLRMRSGAVATFVGTTTFQTEHSFYPPYGGGSLTRAEINGPRGSISVVDDELREAVLDGGRELPPPEQPPNVLADVVAALADPGYRSPTLVRGAEARKSVEIVDALYRAAATGAAVTVGAPVQAPGSAVPASPAAPARS